MTTAADIGNRALEMIGAQTQITGTNPGFDGTPAGKAIGVLYTYTAEVLLREIDPAFARRTITLALSAAPSPIIPWAFEYVYPADCVRLRQVRPAVNDYDVNDPLPVRASVALDIISSTPTKVILSNQANALAVYTSNTATENQWDSGFIEAMVRRLANPLAMALAGHPDYARELLQEAEQYSQLAEAIDEG